MESRSKFPLRPFLILIPAIAALDLVWLGGVMSSFYRSELGSMLRLRGDSMDVVIWAGAIVYLLIAAGIVAFVLPRLPSNKKGRLAAALRWGFLYGVLLYGVYDFTNLAILSHWPLTVVAVDVLWGGVLCAAATALAARVTRG